jgi:hypothetical protein
VSTDTIEQEDTRVALGRFRIAWMKAHGCAEPAGFAVVDHGRRITITWKTQDEAQQHLEAIARIYQRYGW